MGIVEVSAAVAFCKIFSSVQAGANSKVIEIALNYPVSYPQSAVILTFGGKRTLTYD